MLRSLICGRSYAVPLLHRQVTGRLPGRTFSPRSTLNFSSSCPRWQPSAVTRPAARKSSQNIVSNAQHESRVLPQRAPRTSGNATYNPLIQQLANRPSPILIYQSESKAPYVTGCFVLGGICVLYALSNGWTILLDPMVNPSTFVKITFGVVCTAMFGFGCALFYKSFRIVRSITVVPISLANGQRSVRLRLEYGNFRSKVVDVPQDAVTTSRRMFVPQNVVSAEEAVRKIENAKRQREYDRQRIMTLPFRQFGRLFSGFFQGFKSVVSDDEWIFLRVKGHQGRWKVYAKPAWALRNGKHLDDLTRRT